MFQAKIVEADPDQVADDERPQWWYGTARQRKAVVATSDRGETYHRIMIMIMTDQLATANVCSLRFLGIFAGTNLKRNRKKLQHAKLRSHRRCGQF